MAAPDARSSRLFQPMLVGNMQLSHRLVMAPLTRLRATDAHVPTPMMATYYSQRACVPGTLLVTEATLISPKASGAPNVPGIWNGDQISAWRKVTDAVHANGSFVFCQLWALGRAANEKHLAAKGFDVISSSAVAIPKAPGGKGSAYPTPRALDEAEIWDLVGMYAQAARNAIEAGFDGVEIHGANGYLVDQFIQDVCNRRTDAWGGSIEKRSRFCLEVVRAVVDAVGSHRTGIRLSPWSAFQGMKMADPISQFSYLINGLKQLNIAYLHVVESRVAGSADVEATEQNTFAVNIWCHGDDSRPIFLAGGFKPETAKSCVDEEFQDSEVAIVMGRLWISNPDLAFRFQQGLPLERYNRKTFYKVQSSEGYIDYPFSNEFEKSVARL